MSILEPLYRHVNSEAFEREAVTATTNPALKRVANRIFRRHLDEGQPITIEQAYEDAGRAMSDVVQMLDKRGLPS